MTRPGRKPRLESPVRFSVTLPAAMVAQLDAIAEALVRSRAEVLRSAVERGLAEAERVNAQPDEEVTR